MASALALRAIILKNNKRADIVSPSFVSPEYLSFLPGADSIKGSIQSASRAKISVDIKESGIKDFSYETTDGRLNIYFSPKKDHINLKNIDVLEGDWLYDLIICLDTAELPMLGGIYENNKKFFETVPIINIDDSPENTNYGDINLVDIKSSSVAETIWRLIETSPNLDENIINCILAGIIAKTKNFRKATVGTRTLETAGALIKLGAKRNEIMEGFYRTKNVETLKLWGRALARLKHDGKIFWSLLARTDFIHSGAREEDLPHAVHELIANSTGAEAFLLIFEGMDTKIRVIIYSHKQDIELRDMGIINRAGRLAEFPLPYSDLPSAETALIAELKKLF